MITFLLSTLKLNFVDANMDSNFTQNYVFKSPIVN